MWEHLEINKGSVHQKYSNQINNQINPGIKRSKATVAQIDYGMSLILLSCNSTGESLHRAVGLILRE